MMLISSELEEIVTELEASYWVPFLRTPFEDLKTVELSVKADCPALHAAFSSFYSNLCAAKELLEFPYLLVSRLLPEVQAAAGKAQSQRGNIESGVVTDDANMAMTVELVTIALQGSRSHLLGNVQLQRLMHQACLLIWSAVETLSKEVFIACLNQKPALYTTICKLPQLKDRFSVQQAAWPNLLQSHDFDLNGKLGTIVGADRDFSSPQLLKDLYPAIFSGTRAPGFPDGVFESDALMRLGYRRHLVAHRCGVVDQEYLNKTRDDAQQLGSLLKLRGRDIAEGMGTAASFAMMLYLNASYCWPRADDVLSEVA